MTDIINLDEGISQETYVRCLELVVQECNRIARDAGWCWVWTKFGCGLHPWITRLTDTTVQLSVPAGDELQQEWFNPEGWRKHQATGSDARRAAELKLTYGRVLNIAASGQIGLD